MYSLNHQHDACTRPYIDFISINISSYMYYSSSNFTIPSDIFIQISSSSTAYKNYVSTSIVWESQFLINHITIMLRSVMPVTTVEQFSVNSNPGIWVYPRSTRRVLNWLYLFFFKTHFDSTMRLLGGILFLLDFLHTALFIMSLNYFQMDARHP